MVRASVPYVPLYVVQVGELPDAFYIKLVTARPSKNSIVEMLTELRVLLLNRWGQKGVDFDVHCVAATHHLADEGTEGRENTVDLDYVVTFNAVAAIEKVRSMYHTLQA